MDNHPRISAATVQGPFLVKVGYYDHKAVRRLTELMVPDLAAASRACTQYIADEGLGSRDWGGGEVLRDDGSRECVAIVSYNGRVWEPGGTNPEGLRIAGKWEFVFGTNLSSMRDRT